MGGRSLFRLALLGAALLPAGARAQEPSPGPGARPDETPGTREHAWRLAREERRKHLSPYKPGFIERQVLAYEKAERPSIVQFNVLGFYPRVLGIASGSKYGGGLRFWRPDIAGSTLSVHGSALFSRTGYEFYDLQFGRLPHAGKGFPLRSNQGDDVYELATPDNRARPVLYASLRYQHYPQQLFFGLGADSSFESQTSFLQQDALYEAVGGVLVGRHVALTARGGILQAFVGHGEKKGVPTIGDVFDDAQAPGLLEQPDFYKLSGQLLVDYRDRAGNPHRGGLLALQVSRYDDKGEAAYAFTRLAADARGYLPLGSDERLLALRSYASFDRAADGSRVPFYLQEWLGGSHTLRGYEDFRFRGENLLLLQAEYRWEPAPAIELALFAEAGKATRQASDIDLSGLKHDFGFGLRVKPRKDVALRFDIARSPETTRYLLRFSSAY
jgi:hypothetical protein